MTREDVLEAYMLNSKKAIADMLYDTVSRYEEILAEYKNRSCESCKYGSKKQNIPYGDCYTISEYLSIDDIEPLVVETYYSFCCNKHEKKD